MTGSKRLTCGITLDFLFSTKITIHSTIHRTQGTRDLKSKIVENENLRRNTPPPPKKKIKLNKKKTKQKNSQDSLNYKDKEIKRISFCSWFFPKSGFAFKDKNVILI